MSGISIFRKYQKYFVLFGGFIMNLSIGSFYCSRNNVHYLTVIPRNNGTPCEITVRSKEVWASSGEAIGMGSSMYLGAFLVNRLGAPLTMLFGGWIASLNVLALIYTTGSDSLQFIIPYALGKGFGSGIVYGVTICVACSWFPKARGLVTGVVVAGRPISKLLFTKAQWDIMRKTEFSTAYYGFDLSYLILACVYILLQILGVILLQNSSSESLPLADENYLINEDRISISMESEIDGIEIDVEPLTMIREIDFWNLWLTYLLLTASFGLNMALYEGFASILGVVPAESIYFERISIYALIILAVGGVCWGWIIDRVRYKVVMLVISSSVVVLFLVLCILAKCHHSIGGPASYIVLYDVCVLLQYFVSSGTFPIFPYISAKVYGNINFIANYGMLCTAWAVSGAVIGISVLVMEELNNPCHPSIYLYGFITGLVMAIISTIATVLYKGDQRYYQRLTNISYYLNG